MFGGHVSSGGDEVIHIVTGIFGEQKGQTNQRLPLDVIECTIVGGPFDGESVFGFFTPVGGPPT